MRITHDRNAARGVTQLMYVGDSGDGLGGMFATGKWVKIGVAAGVAALLYHLATRPARRR